MYIERLTIQNFRCFGPDPTVIELDPTLTAFVGVNGAGKTAAMEALRRLFGITRADRTIRPSDFHVPAEEVDGTQARTLVIEALLAFPELDADGDAPAVPGFFQHMTIDDNGAMKCRLRLAAEWIDDGSVEGVIDEDIHAIQTLGDFDHDDLKTVRAADRALIQLVYVPASRDAYAHMRAFLGGRLWRAARWSNDVKSTFTTSGTALGTAFGAENPVKAVQDSLQSRWQEVHGRDQTASPRFRVMDARFEEFVRSAGVIFSAAHGRDRTLDELGDGERSLFHLALTAATLDVEDTIVQRTTDGFVADDLALPALTVVAVEEPENSLAPYYLARTVGQLRALGERPRVQALLSSHSASILARVEPREVRHFRLDPETQTARVRPIRLPEDGEEAEKYVREAVQAYPELYFARFVVFGEGASEEIVLPRIARALNLDVDRSFVAIVPFGGRHVHHFWRLVHDLDVPHATLLDLDWGRAGGGWGRIKTVCKELEAFGASPGDLYSNGIQPHAIDPDAFDDFAPEDADGILRWVLRLRQFGVYFSEPLDLDYSMLRSFPGAYQHTAPGGTGPSASDARPAVLGPGGEPGYYDARHNAALGWYRYLFLGRGKPGTHVQALDRLEDGQVAQDVPDFLRVLLTFVAGHAAAGRAVLPQDAPYVP